MFDPTIFDNLKVVFEGALYDLDREGTLTVNGREDLVDLAAMSRLFRMQVEKPGGNCRAELELSSHLLDFAGELRRLRLADEVPGCHLRLSFWLPLALVAESPDIDASLQTVWGEVAEILHEETRILLPRTVTGAEGAQKREGEYRVTLYFREKIDEDNMEDVEPLLMHLVNTLEELEARFDT